MSDFIDTLFHKINRPFWRSLVVIGIPWIILVTKYQGKTLPGSFASIMIMAFFEFYFAIFYAVVAVIYFVLKYLQRI